MTLRPSTAAILACLLAACGDAATGGSSSSDFATVDAGADADLGLAFNLGRDSEGGDAGVAPDSSAPDARGLDALDSAETGDTRDAGDGRVWDSEVDDTGDSDGSDADQTDVGAPDADADGARGDGGDVKPDMFETGRGDAGDADRGDTDPDAPDGTVAPDAIDASDTDGAGPDMSLEHPLDDLLRVNHLQAVGTHNSYHLESFLPVPQWDYSHLPLDRQAEEQGVRQFELDLNWSGGGFDVFHIVAIDAATNCDTFGDCLADLWAWASVRPLHHPMVVMLEMKSGADDAIARLNLIEASIRSVWPDDRILTPDEVRGTEATLRDALFLNGWPTLGETRGHVLFVLHDGGGWRDALLSGAPSAEGHILFPDAFGDTGQAFAAFHSMNDPVGGAADIQRVVGEGHLVRTRADTDGNEARDVDFSRAQAAFDSAAHFVSTDFPGPPAEGEYGVAMPGGSPSRCNPIAAPALCDSLAVEDPALLAP